MAIRSHTSLEFELKPRPGQDLAAIFCALAGNLRATRRTSISTLHIPTPSGVRHISDQLLGCKSFADQDLSWLHETTTDDSLVIMPTVKQFDGTLREHPVLVFRDAARRGVWRR
jgi:hypothetical protein